MSPHAEESTRPAHPIQVAARRAGISAHLLRAWEKRYQAVVPGRTASGRRLYSDADIARLRLLDQAIEGGRRIGDLAGLDTDALRALVAEDRRLEQPLAPAPELPAVDAEPVAAGLAAIRRFDGGALRATLTRSLATTSLPDFVERMAKPLMHQVGLLWQRGDLSPSHEHLASATLRSVLGDLLERLEPAERAPIIVVATPAGQRHESGALAAALTAAVAGWKPLFLGPDLPAADIARAAQGGGARVVALSITAPDAAAAELARLRELLGPDTLILIGGQGALGTRVPDEKTEHVGSLAELRARLASLARYVADR
jgi:DNA-binding transcriptional MerR regulator